MCWILLSLEENTVYDAIVKTDIYLIYLGNFKVQHLKEIDLSLLFWLH